MSQVCCVVETMKPKTRWGDLGTLYLKGLTLVMSSSGNIPSRLEQKRVEILRAKLSKKIKDILIFKLKMMLPSEGPKFKPEQRHFFKNV